jgi:NTE family protein
MDAWEPAMMFVPKLRPANDAAQPDAMPQREPVIGLALGAGAARGWAHVGIMNKLDEMGIRPRVVVGTSIGAVVGGCWASGKLGELEVFARSLTKRGMLGMMDLNIMGSGLISGDRLRRQLEERFKNAMIEELPVRFASIATEIRTGHEIWLTRGPITEAMRASYALPGIFVPVQVGGRWLIDGALTNPVPVSVARALGAEMIIAVNLHTDVLGRSGVIFDHGGTTEGLPKAPTPEQDAARQGLFSAMSSRIRHPFGGAAAPPVDKSDPAPGLMSVMLDAFNISQDRIARARLAGDPPDIMVTPKLGGIGLSEFHRADEAIAAGEAAIMKVMDDILDIRTALTMKAKSVT